MILSEVKSRNDLTRFLNEEGLQGHWAELGVAEGEFSERLLQTSSSLLYSIDRWASDRGHDNKQYFKALQRLRVYGLRSVVIRTSFEDAAYLFEDESFDFIYIDGYAHTGQDGGATLELWWPKLRPGGLFAGHDYEKRFKPMIPMIDAFCRQKGITPHITTKDLFQSWMAIK